MLHLTLFCVGALRENWLRAAAAEYEKRLSAYCVWKNIETEDDQALRSALRALPSKSYRIELFI